MNATDRLFGEIAVMKGYLTHDLLGKALNYQQTLPVHQPLGQILIQKNVLTHGQVQDVMNEQRRRSSTYQVMPNPPMPQNPHMPHMNGGAHQNQPYQHPQNNHHPQNNRHTPTNRHTPVNPHYQMPPQNIPPPNHPPQNMPPPNIPPPPVMPPRPTSGPYSRNQMGPNSSGAQKSKKQVPPGVDESVIDDDGNVDIIGRTIGGCHVTQKIGQGAMGFNFLASHSNLNRQVVVKILPPKAAMTKKNLERFLREARAAAKLEHPNIVQVLNVDKSPEGLYYIIMQYIDGKDLDKLVKEQGPQTWQEATRIIFEAASGLKLAHDNEIIHRDIKAENIMMTQNGVTKVTDFGLAKDLNSNLKLTADGALIGTPLYMAPEIGRVPQIDGRVDIFSLGVTYYYLLTAVQPFRGFKTMEILSARAHNQIKPPEKYKPDIPKDVRRVLGKMLTKDRDERYLNMGDLIGDLQALQYNNPVQAGPPPLWGEDGVPGDAKPKKSSGSKTEGGSKKGLLVGVVFLILAAVGGAIAFMVTNGTI